MLSPNVRPLPRKTTSLSWHLRFWLSSLLVWGSRSITALSATSPPPPPVDVAIVGAGPAGLALAHGLLDRGHSVRILERRPSFRPVGSAVFLHPFALNSLDRLSPAVSAAVREHATEVGTVTVTSATNPRRNRAVFDNFDLAAGIYGNPFVTIRFWDLLRGLRRGLPEDIFAFGCRVSGYRHIGGGHVEVLFATGHSDGDDRPGSIEARMVVDAGGVRSAIRKQMLPRSRRRPFCDACMAVLPAAEAAQVLSDHPGAMTDRELGFWVTDVDAVVMATLQSGDVWWTYLRFDDDGDDGSSASRPERRVGCRFPPFVADAMARTKERNEILISDLPVTARLGEGMVTLLGDSAHAQLPTLGLGCSAAFADVEELCRQLDEGGLCERALRQYERRRMPQTAALQLASRGAAYAVRFLARLIK